MIPPGPLQLTVISLGGLSFLASALVLGGSAAIVVARLRGAHSERARGVVPVIAALLACAGWGLLRLVIPMPAWPVVLVCSADALLWLLDFALAKAKRS